ncbi:MAG: tetratricopeptide repeat protein, partial [Aggregatilineales bacterium]
MDEAILNMGHALDLYPYNAEYHAARGFFFLEDGIPDKAAADFDLALQRNSYEMLANFGRGVLAYREKNWETAIQHFKTAWAAESKRPETLYYLALSHHHHHQNTQALQWMTQAKAAYETAENRKLARQSERWISVLGKLVDA